MYLKIKPIVHQTQLRFDEWLSLWRDQSNHTHRIYLQVKKLVINMAADIPPPLVIQKSFLSLLFINFSIFSAGLW